MRQHLALKAMPKYERKARRQTKVAAHEAYLRECQTAARPDWIPASVLRREIVEQGLPGRPEPAACVHAFAAASAASQTRGAFRDRAMGEQLQVDWVEFCKGSAPLHAFCATMG